MRTGRIINVCRVLSVATLSLSTSVLAQGRRTVTSSPDQLVASFVHDYEGQGKLPATAGMDLSAVLLDRADYPRGSVEAVLDALETVALSERSPRIRAMAALYLSSSASRDALHPRPGTLARLERIYRQSGDAQVRAAVVSGLARSANDGEALAFLEGVATRDPQEFPGASKAALAAIASHGDEGSGVLRRIHQAKAVHDPDARQWLDLVATKGYRIR